MPKKNVTFKVTPGSGVKGYWIAVDDTDITLEDHTGTIQLTSGGMKHMLTWWLVGNAGSTLSIVGTAGQQVVVTIKESKIPAHEHKGAGSKRFELA